MSATYPAEMFRPGSGARAVSGHLTVELDVLRFRGDPEQGGEENTLILHTQGLGCRLSGYDNRTFFFTHPTAEGAEVAVKDSSIFNDEVLNRLAIFEEARRVGRATHRRFWGCITLLVLGAVVLLAGVGVVAALFLRWVLGG